MKIIILVNGKQISKKVAADKFGKERIENRIKDAIEHYTEDPLEPSTWMDGMEIKVIS